MKKICLFLSLAMLFSNTNYCFAKSTLSYEKNDSYIDIVESNASLQLLQLENDKPISTFDTIYAEMTEYPVEGGNIYIWNSQIWDCDDTVTKADIPRTVNGKKITGIVDIAFSRCTKLESVTIPDTVTTIGGKGFQNCCLLTEVNLPQNLKKITSNAFSKSGIISIKIPGSVTYIGAGAFSECDNLVSVEFQDGYEPLEFGDYASGSYVFHNCKNLENVIINRNIDEISSNMFEDCKKLKNIVVPDSVKYIREAAFRGCSCIENINLPSNLTKIEYGAFSNSGLKKIKLPKSVEQIGGYAFSNCKYLVNATLSGNFSANGMVFANCENLSDVYIEEGLEEVPDSMFHSCYALKKIVLPYSIKKIGDSSFRGCRSLESINIHSNIEVIGGGAFAECYALKDISIPNTVRQIGQFAFNQCQFENISLSNELEELSPYIFYSASHLKRIVIPNNVKKIGQSSFCGCYELKEITFSKNVKIIEDYAFDGNHSLSDVYYLGTEKEWNDIQIGEYNDSIINANIHFEHQLTEEEKENFYKKEDLSYSIDMSDEITYNADENTYNCSKTNLTLTLGNKILPETDDDIPKNVNWDITLPEGFSFDENDKKSDYMFGMFTELPTMESITNAIYFDRPSLGRHYAKIHITGDNIKEVNKEFEIFVGSTVFNPNIYKANYLINSEIGSTMENTYISEETPAQAIYNAGVESGLKRASESWEWLMDTLAAIDDPSKTIDMTFEEKNMYEAIIMDMFETSVDSKVVDMFNTRTRKEIRSIINLVSSDLKTKYMMDISNINMKTLSADEKNKLMDSLNECFKKQYPNLTGAKEVTDNFGEIVEYGTDIESAISQMVQYYELTQLSDSMKSVMQDMYDYCPSDNLALKGALFECISVMNSSQKKLEQQMCTYTTACAGKRVAEELINTMWKDIKTELYTANPYAALYEAAYKTSKFVTDVCYNSDKISENWCKIVALMNTESLVRKVYEKNKSAFLADKNDFNAQKYNTSVELMFNMISADCDCASSFVNSVDKGIAAKVAKARGYTKTDELIKSISSIKTSTEIFYDYNVTLDWISQLETDNPILFNAYSYLLDKNYEQFKKKYNIACPVDIYIYDSHNNLIGSVINNLPYCDENSNISLSVNNDEKIFTVYDRQEYRIVYKGNDAGKMNITITETENDETRKVCFNDIPLSTGMTYNAIESGSIFDNSNYSLKSESDGTINADYDSYNDSATTYVVNIQNGYFTEDFDVSKGLNSGNRVEIAAHIPADSQFVGWTSDVGTEIFEDANDKITQVVVPDADVNITAIIKSNSVLLYPFGDADADGNITASDAAFVLQKTLISTFELPIQNKTDDWLKYADVDADNNITASDAAFILQKTLISTFELPAEKKYK